MRNIKFYIHPFIFSTYPLFFLFSYNVSQISIIDFIFPLLLFIFLTLIFLKLLTIITKKLSAASVLTSIYLFVWFSFGHIFSFLETLDIIISKYQLLVLIFIILILFAFFILKTKSDLAGLNVVLSVVAISLVIMCTYRLTVGYSVNRISRDDEYRKSVISGINIEDKSYLKRDIYYLIFDQYGNSETLKQYFNFDNSKFISFLKSKGFYVADNSMSNYPHTQHSLASSLNMIYLDYLEELKTDIHPIFLSMIKNHDVGRFLRSLGYKFIFLGNSEWPFHDNEYADKNYNLTTSRSSSYFLCMLYKESIFRPILELTDLDVKLDHHLNHTYRVLEWKRVDYKFEVLSDLIDVDSPKFVFAHFLTPHGPYVHDRNGDYLSLENQKSMGNKKSYVNQIMYLNGRIEIFVSELLKSSEVLPIIIIQSDEGPFTTYSTKGLDKNVTESLKQKFQILNAFFLPGIEPDQLYSHITPVNTFRIVLNQYFDTDLEILEDRHYYTSYSDPHHFVDITDRIAFDKGKSN